jgi:hypothetical protein
VLADWFREDGLSEAQVDVDIKPIERMCFYLARDPLCQKHRNLVAGRWIRACTG